MENKELIGYMYLKKSLYEIDNFLRSLNMKIEGINNLIENFFRNNGIEITETTFYALLLTLFIFVLKRE
ncbi:MAG: hypothetical protein ABIM60_05220 [candidate division WOR-3 bacterium]